MLGGSVIGGQLTNAGSVTGFGTFSPSVINNSGATITASGGGTLTLTAIPFQNGIVNILGTLDVASAWSNGSAGTVTINGGVLTGGTFTVDGTVGGNGTIAANMIVGSKTVTVNGGTTECDRIDDHERRCDQQRRPGQLRDVSGRRDDWLHCCPIPATFGRRTGCCTFRR